MWSLYWIQLSCAVFLLCAVSHIECLSVILVYTDKSKFMLVKCFAGQYQICHNDPGPLLMILINTMQIYLVDLMRAWKWSIDSKHNAFVNFIQISLTDASCYTAKLIWCVQKVLKCFRCFACLEPWWTFGWDGMGEAFTVPPIEPGFPQKKGGYLSAVREIKPGLLK